MSEMTYPTDNELIARLRDFFNAVDPVPAAVEEFACAAFAWRNIDGELGDIDRDR